jgi:hypothetical protein
MNFFGHAWVAGWFSEQAPFILGAMLPDFASALGVAEPTSRHPELHAGIRLHHQTDRVFHQAAVFRELEQDGRAWLSKAGVAKGSRRALAHVGVEYLIDAELERHSPHWQGYAQALHFAGSAVCRDELQWGDAGVGERLTTLCQRIGASTRDTGTRRLASRLVATLASRARLALSSDDAPHVEPWLSECRPKVAALLPSLLDELTRELGAPDGAVPRTSAATQVARGEC